MCDYLYLRLRISFGKPLLNVACNGKKDLLHIKVRFGTLKDIAHTETNNFAAEKVTQFR
jgi:hypothetical protein